MIDDILLFDIEENILLVCALKCPFKGAMKAINMSSDERDKLLVYGYQRELWQSKEFKNMSIFPVVLLNENIHIVDNGDMKHCENLQHWKIYIDDILNSIA